MEFQTTLLNCFIILDNMFSFEMHVNIYFFITIIINIIYFIQNCSCVIDDNIFNGYDFIRSNNLVFIYITSFYIVRLASLNDSLHLKTFFNMLNTTLYLDSLTLRFICLKKLINKIILALMSII